MYDERFGSYSMAATLAGTPSLERLKSILRYRRLAPPPRWREVLRPRALRPPDLVRPSTSVFSGSVFVISEKSGYETKRRPGLVGLGLRIGIGQCFRSWGRVPSSRLLASAGKDAEPKACPRHVEVRGRSQ